MTVQIINQEWLDSNSNQKHDQSLLSRYGQYLSSPIGKFRNILLIQKSLDFGQQLKGLVGLSPSLKAVNLSKNLGIGIKSLGLFSLPGTAVDAVKSVSALHEEDGVDWGRKTIKAIRNLSDLVASTIYSYGFVTANQIPLGSVKAMDLTSDFADLHLCVSDYNRASELEVAATGDIKEVIVHSKNYHLLGIIKTVISISMATFGFGLLAFASSSVAFTALLAASLVGILFAIGRDLYKEMGKHPVIDFDREVRVIQESFT